MTTCETHQWVQVGTSYRDEAAGDAWMGGHSVGITNHHTVSTYECTVCGAQMVEDHWSDGLGNGGDTSYIVGEEAS